MDSTGGEVTQLLVAWSDGDGSALGRLVSLVEPELRRVAVGCLSRERPGHALEANSIVNEAYLRLTGAQPIDWQNRRHFFCVSAKIMRRILVDDARRRSLQRGAFPVTLSLPDAELAVKPPGIDIIALEAALDKLASFDEQKARIVELKFYSGLSEQETSEALGIPLRTAQREWSLARAWLYRELSAQA
jgi:RNA polymerase sigma-70 factor, ECF subfamily